MRHYHLFLKGDFREEMLQETLSCMALSEAGLVG